MTRDWSGVTIEIITLFFANNHYNSYCYPGDYPTRGWRSCAKCNGVSALNCTAKPRSPAVWACRSPRHAQNPLSGERRKTLLITHHALSPPPSHHHMYIIHLINWLQRFYRITMSLKIYFAPNSDGKQWFITTTNHYNNSSCSFAIGCADLSKTQNSHHWPITLKQMCWTCYHIHNRFC